MRIIGHKQFVILRVGLCVLLSLLAWEIVRAQDLNVIERDGKFGFRWQGKTVIAPRYDSAIEKWSDHYAVEEGGRWGLVSPAGREVIPCAYDSVGHIVGSLFWVAKDGLRGVTDGEGRQVLPVMYEAIDHIDDDQGALVKYAGRWCMVRNGEYSYDSTQFIFHGPDRLPFFPGCEHLAGDIKAWEKCATERMYTYIFEHITYPKTALQRRIQGMVVLSFVVSDTGEIHSIQLRRGIGGGCDEESIRVVEGMPRWDPGMVDGRAVAVWYTLPVRFVIK